MTAEERFYRRHYETLPNRGPVSCEPSAARVAAMFDPGGRYHLVRRMLEERPRIGDLVEIGCGGGECTLWMRRFAQRCVGCDVFLFPHLKGSEHEGTVFLAANANERLPFEDGRFDAVVAMMVMEHLFDPFYFCQEVNRILRPAGTLFLNVPLITSLKRRLELLLGKMPVTSSPDWFANREWDGGHLHYFALPDLERLLAVSGFEVAAHAGVGRMHALKTRFPTFLASEISIAARKRGSAGPRQGALLP